MTALWKGLARTTATFAPVPNRALLSVTGSQSTEFLNGLLTTSLPQPGGHRFSALLHAQGRVMYDMFLWSQKDGYILEYDSKATEVTSEVLPLLTYLKRHVLRSKVKLRPVTEDYSVWASWGTSHDHNWESSRQWHFERSGAIEPVWPKSDESPWGKIENVLMDRRAKGMGRRWLIRNDVGPSSLEGQIGEPHDYLLHRCIQGVPEGSADIVPMQAFPMESNLDVMGALDFRKGCYVGQELTVRTYHTGAIRKRILPVVLEEVGKPSQPSEHISGPNTSRSSWRISGSLSSGIDIAPSVLDQERSIPRPRGTGKLLSNHSGIGLALLRLDHVSGWERGVLKLECTDGTTKYNVTPRWPEWWPKEPPEEANM